MEEVKQCYLGVQSLYRRFESVIQHMNEAMSFFSNTVFCSTIPKSLCWSYTTGWIVTQCVDFTTFGRGKKRRRSILCKRWKCFGDKNSLFCNSLVFTLLSLMIDIRTCPKPIRPLALFHSFFKAFLTCRIQLIPHFRWQSVFNICIRLL